MSFFATGQNRSLPPTHKALTRASWQQWIPIACILAVAAVAYFFRLESEGLWLDELTSLEDTAISPKEAYFENQLRPLYYFLLMGWRQFGSTDGWYRTLSIIFALISVFLIYQLTRRLTGEAEARLAATMMALSPIIINHAQEIRMYTVSMCMCIAGTLCLANALLVKPDEKPSQRSLAGWSLFRLLAIYTVPLNVTMLLPDALIIFTRFRKNKPVLLSFAKWLGVLIVLWSPSILSVIQESSPSGTFASHHETATPPGPDRIFRQLKFLTVWPFAAQSNKVASLFYKVFTLLVAGLLGASLIRKRLPLALRWTALWLVLPLIPILVFSYLFIPIWTVRYLLFVSPYLFILLAAGLTRLWQQWRPSAVAIGLAYAIALSGGLYHHYTAQERPDYKYNIATIEQYEQPGDAIIWGYYYTEGLDHYYDGTSDIHVRPLRFIDSPDSIPDWLKEFPSNYERLWLTLDPASSMNDPVLAAVSDIYQVEETFTFERGSSVLLLTPKPNAELTSSR